MSLLEALWRAVARGFGAIRRALIRGAVASADSLPAHEDVVVSTRRHSIIAIRPVWSPILGAVVLIWFLDAVPKWSPLHTILVCGEIFLVARWLWLIAEWQHETFTLTTRRVMLDYGIITRRRAMMPISKVTDLTYMRSPLGDLLNYGHVIIESAGQDQALHDVLFLPSPTDLFQRIDAVVFGVAVTDLSDD